MLSPRPVNVKMSFVPVSGKVREPLEITRSIRFRPSVIPWAIRSNEAKSFSRSGIFLVDTDIDGRPDTFLPGTSNFVAGLRSSQNKIERNGRDVVDIDVWDHQDPLHEHATTTPPPTDPTAGAN